MLLLQFGYVFVLVVVDGHVRRGETLAVNGVVALEANEQDFLSGNDFRGYLATGQNLLITVMRRKNKTTRHRVGTRQVRLGDAIHPVFNKLSLTNRTLFPYPVPAETSIRWGGVVEALENLNGVVAALVLVLQLER